MNQATEDIRNLAIRREYGRRPYQAALADPDNPSSDMSYSDRMRRVTGKGMFDQRLEHQSEFKKPYMSTDYSAMEHWYMPPFSKPYYPAWMTPSFPGPVPGPGTVWFDAHIPSERRICSISCDTNYVGKACTGPDAAIECTYLVLMLGAYASWSILPNEDGITPAIGEIQDTGDGVRITPPEGGWGENVASGKTSFKLKVQLRQGGGSGDEAFTVRCTDETTVYCTPCPVSPVLEFDDTNTPDTIAAGNNIDVYVTGGLSLFTYVVSGTGYTWNSNGLATLVSSSRNEQLDCVAGA